MSKSPRVTVVASLAAAVLVGATALQAAADPTSPPPIATELLTGRAVFTDDVGLKIKIKTLGRTDVVKTKDASRTLVARFTVQPGARFPWHSHPGPVIVNVVEGSLVYIEDDTCEEETYQAGTAFVDPGQGHTHSAYNAGDRPAVLVATFFEAPAEGALLLPGPAPACAG